MNNLKKTKGITENLKNFLNIDIDHIQSKDIDKILQLPLPTKQIDNLVKITNHTNENLKTLKDNLVKNRNLIAEEISCLNEVFVNCQTSLHEIDSSQNNSGDQEYELVRENGNIDLEVENIEVNEEFENESLTRRVHTPQADYEAKELLMKIKKDRLESVGTPPKLDLTKFN